MIRRAILAVKGRFKQNIVLLFVMFIIASLILASLSINKASDEAVEYARESLGAEVSLTADMDKVRENMQSLKESGIEGLKNFSRPSIYISDVESLMNSKYAVDAKYKVSVNATPINFEIEETNSGFMTRMAGGSGVVFQVANAFSLMDEVIEGKINLIEGESFDENTTDGVIINDELSIYNDLEIGDVIEFSNSQEETYEYTIIGIYETLENDSAMGGSSSTIYTNFSSADKIMDENTYNEGDYKIDNAVIYVNDPANVEAFIDEGYILIDDLEERDLELSFNDTMYELMAGPIESVGEFSMTILYIVVIAGIVIISLIVYGYVNARNYEIGVLLSLGETKKKIIFQFVTELLIVFILASSLTVITSNFISNAIGDSLLESQLTMSEEQTNVGVGGRQGMKSMFGNQNNTEDIDVIEEINITVSIEEYTYLLFSGLGIILVSMLFPVISIFKYSPKEILTRKE